MSQKNTSQPGTPKAKAGGGESSSSGRQQQRDNTPGSSQTWTKGETTKSANMMDEGEDGQRPMTRSRSKVESMPSDNQKRQRAGHGTPSRKPNTSHQTVRPNSKQVYTPNSVRPRSVSHDQYRQTNNYKTVPEPSNSSSSSSRRRATADNHHETPTNQTSKPNHSNTTTASLKSSQQQQQPPHHHHTSPFASSAKYKHVAPPTQMANINNNNQNTTVRGSANSLPSSQTAQPPAGTQNSSSRRNPSPRIAAEMAKMKIANSVNYR